METSYVPTMGYEKLTVSNAAKQITSTKHTVQLDTAPDLRKTAKSALLTVEGADIRFTTDGTAPVAATTGHFIPAGVSFTINGYQNIVALKMIRNAAVDATVHVTLYGG